MDFLLLFSHQGRVVIEIDGQQHYSVDSQAMPRLYAEMVSEDRKLRLAGYEIYRFGGYELQEPLGDKVVIEFFQAEVFFADGKEDFDIPPSADVFQQALCRSFQIAGRPRARLRDGIVQRAAHDDHLAGGEPRVHSFG